ncbi:hypothetical protein [Nonomuraea sp. NPDC049709]|uniref:hypothetical protein n=1 Tax=Nonomuraea sp. NPDC049709 TaxID=3154736 RepID=UPI00343D168F
MSLINNPLLIDAHQLPLPGRGRTGVLTGGRSRERARALLSGNTALAALQRLGLSAVLIDTAQPGLLDQLSEIDVALLAIAGQYAEDGKLQGLLEHLGIPYTGSGVLASALAMHKTAAKTMVAAHGVAVLAGADIDAERPADLVAKAAARELVDYRGSLYGGSAGGGAGGGRSQCGHGAPGGQPGRGAVKRPVPDWPAGRMCRSAGQSGTRGLPSVSPPF